MRSGSPILVADLRSSPSSSSSSYFDRAPMLGGGGALWSAGEVREPCFLAPLRVILSEEGTLNKSASIVDDVELGRDLVVVQA